MTCDDVVIELQDWTQCRYESKSLEGDRDPIEDTAWKVVEIDLTCSG